MENAPFDLRLPAGTPDHVAAVLKDLAEVSAKAFGPDLVAILLFGSAADGNLRATSDVNLLFVLARFEQSAVDRVREALQSAQTAARLSAMFVLDSELNAVGEAFAVKFFDIARRHFLILGRDLLAGFRPSREALIRRSEQVLQNLVLRLRERYAMVSLREEQLATVVAEAVSPLRAAASALFELEGRPASTPKEALKTLAAELSREGFAETLKMMSRARETRALPPGCGAATLIQMITLGQGLLARVRSLG
jgi:predicted nucleotidyltransferase